MAAKNSLKKKSVKKEIVSPKPKKSPSELVTLDGMIHAVKNMPGAADKKGFELYQVYRDFFILSFTNPEHLKHFTQTDDAHNSQNNFIRNLQLFDQAYIDNFMLCLTYRLKAPESYESDVKLIDQYVRPKRNEGLECVYQEAGGLLAFILQKYKKVSRRQALRIAAYVTGYQTSTIQKSYKERVKKVGASFAKEAPPLLALALVYWTINKAKRDLNKLAPLGKGTRSRNTHEEGVQAYWSFTNSCVRAHQAKIMEHLEKTPSTLILEIAKEYDITFPLSEKALQQPDSKSACFVIGTAFVLEFMPTLIKDFEEIRKHIT